jgi:hypothetical protein
MEITTELVILEDISDDDYNSLRIEVVKYAEEYIEELHKDNKKSSFYSNGIWTVYNESALIAMRYYGTTVAISLKPTVSAHEFGHALGIIDAYSVDNYSAIPNNEIQGITAGSSVRKGVNANDIEMMLYAFEKDAVQRFIPTAPNISDEKKIISEAIRSPMQYTHTTTSTDPETGDEIKTLDTYTYTDPETGKETLLPYKYEWDDINKQMVLVSEEETQ